MGLEDDSDNSADSEKTTLVLASQHSRREASERKKAVIKHSISLLWRNAYSCQAELH